MPALIFLLFIPLIIAIGIAAYMYNIKLREAMQAVAAKLNLRFYPGKDRHLAKQYKFLNNLHQGSNRYAFNIMAGQYQNNEVTIFN